MKKKLVSAMVAAMVVVSMAGCGQTTETTVVETESVTETTVEATSEAETDDDENYETGDASLDNIRNQDEIGDNELLVVSFGTSYNDNRRLTIGAIEQKMEDAFGDEYSVRRGFTSQIIIDHVEKRDGYKIDNVGEALNRAIDNGVKNLVIQPTHLMNGFEYTDLVDEVSQYADAFEKVAVGEPLLTSDEDFVAVMKAITEATAEYDDGETAICFMGHGTEADSNGVYDKMQKLLAENGFENYYIGTVEAAPALDDVVAAVKEKEYKKVVLEPLMIVAGDHANNDMAGDEEDSWKSVFEAEGYEVTCILRGLGELPAIQDIFVAHAKKAMPAEQLVDGVYEDITVDSSSSMFNIVSCKLTVANGEMTAEMTMSGTGYSYLYMGTGEEATQASEKEYIPYTENAEGAHVFTVPVEALDTEIACAAFSKKKQEWYDRTLVFRADSLPQTAYTEGTIVTCKDLGLEDGSYTVEVTLSGGSGKTTVESPATMTVENQTATVVLVWSSPNYDYMVVDGEKYEPINTEGNSTFEIPVLGFDWEMPVTADTTAMSTPHEIDYTLYFTSDSITKVE